jgi:hypothetical protein
MPRKKSDSNESLVEPEDLEHEDSEDPEDPEKIRVDELYPDEEEDSKESERTHHTMYELICDILDTRRDDDESVDDFKIRVVKHLSNVNEWPDEEYHQLPEAVQDWVYDTTQIYKVNKDPERKRKKKLPALPGLDADPHKRRQRPDIDSPLPLRRGRGRTGEDCMTRTMRYLRDHPDENETKNIQEALKEQYQKEYSYPAVRYAQNAWRTVQHLMNEGKEEQEAEHTEA